MMLRSSSTPILGSLLSSYSESPNHNHHSEFNSPKHLPRKLSIHQTGPLNLITPSTYTFNSPSPSINAEFGGTVNLCTNGLRRVQSDGNLGQLTNGSCNSFDEFSHQIPNKKFPRKPNCSVLQTILSFSVHRRRTGNEEDYYEEEDDEEEEETDEEEEKRGTVEYEDISLNKGMEYNMNSNHQWSENRKFMVELQNEGITSKMHLAKGLGTMTGGFNGGGGHSDYRSTGFGGDGNDGASMEEYYQGMMVDNPGNPLFLRNYAQFLHQSKDLGGAEEYYSRAILVDPGDGEVLSQYAKLTWELHRDEERASSYFQRAVQAAPEDCHVLAAYAGFLWETEEDNDNDILCTELPLHQTNKAPVAVVKA